MQWQPSLGAWLDGERTRFRVWANRARRVDVVISSRHDIEASYPLQKSDDGTFSAALSDMGPGTEYRFRVDGRGPFPDPASRFQPQGVHGPSEVIDPAAFAWTDGGWSGVALGELILYELHVGTFSPQGTFQGVIERLQWLADLGVTAIELMPVAEFAGSRNWGYDGVGLFAPSHHYGTPDDLRRLVDRAHALGIAVFLDVVYNHLGPDGNYLSQFSPCYVTKRHKTVWGAALNFDGRHSAAVRQFFIENALHWIHDYHIDGLRLDATHAILDDSRRHFLAELSDRVRDATRHRRVLLIAEDHRNLRTMLLPEEEGGWGLDGVWADDFHHQVRRRLAGDQESYFRDFTGSMADLAETMRRGWFYCGQHSDHWDDDRGSDPAGVPLSRFVYCLQNHDQIGNRAFGERLHHQIDPAAYRAATALLLTGPCTPLLFMGQEWGASTPFRYFTDHEPQLGKKITRGRRREFQAFSAFSDPQQRKKIPDPQAEGTFLSSRLDWQEIEQPEHASLLRLYRRLLAWRRNQLAPLGGEMVSSNDRPSADASWEVVELSESTIGMRYGSDRDSLLLILIHLPAHERSGAEGHQETVVTTALMGDPQSLHWELMLTTEEEAFANDPVPPEIDCSGPAPVVRFFRPAAVILQGVRR